MVSQKITTENDNLIIEWSDNKKSEISLRVLRRDCPCATCLAERDAQSKDFIRIYNQNQIQIKDIEQVGSYAIKITWRDNHSTGIYEYTYLKKLAKSV